MYKSCTRCGKVHDTNYKCNHNRYKKDTEARRLRQKNSWHSKSEEIRKASNYLCSVCKDNNIYTYNHLETHHIDKLEERPDRLLDDYNLICLCVEHHKEADAGKIDKDYLFKLAKDREDNM